MKREIDCLLVGYLGFSYADINEKLCKEGLEHIQIEKDFNAAVAYLATYLNKNNLTFDFINYIEDETERLINLLETCDIKAIGFSTTYCTSMEEVKRIVSFIRKVNPNPAVKIILGGAYIAKLFGDPELQEDMVVQHVLKKIDADFYIDSFQGETALTNIVNALKNGDSFEAFPNIYYKEGKKYKYTIKVLEDNRLEDNMVDWSLFVDRVGSIVPVRTTISCPFSCSYCSYHINAGKYRYTDVEFIERELNQIDKLEKVKTVHFIDDTFNVPVERFKEILRMMIKNKYHFNWCSFIRSQFLDDEAVQLMKESKCIGTFLGIESGNQEVLNIMNKKVTVEEIKRGNALLDKYDIQRFGSFIVGFPGETENTVKDTMDLIRDINLKFYGVCVWYYDLRTPISKEPEKYQIKGKDYNWVHFTMDVNTATEYGKYMRENITTASHFVQDPTWLFQVIDSGIEYEKIKGLIPQDPTQFTVKNLI